MSSIYAYEKSFIKVYCFFITQMSKCHNPVSHAEIGIRQTMYKTGKKYSEHIVVSSCDSGFVPCNLSMCFDHLLPLLDFQIINST